MAQDTSSRDEQLQIHFLTLQLSIASGGGKAVFADEIDARERPEIRSMATSGKLSHVWM